LVVFLSLRKVELARYALSSPVIMKISERYRVDTFFPITGITGSQINNTFVQIGARRAIIYKRKYEYLNQTLPQTLPKQDL
jgi:hypothetical protein